MELLHNLFLYNLQLHALRFRQSWSSDNQMAAHEVRVRAFRLLFRLFLLAALPVLFRAFRRRRSQLQLYLAVQCGEFGFQLFQLVLLLPCLSGYLLQLRDFLLQHLVLLPVLVDDTRYPLQCVQKINGCGVCVSHRQMPVVVAVPVVARHHKTVVAKLQPVFECPFADHLDGEAVQFAHALVLSAGRGIPGYLLQALSDCLFVCRIQPVNLYQVEPVAFLVCLCGSRELLPVISHGGYGGLVVPQFSGLALQFQLRLALALAEGLAFTLQRGNLLLQLRLVQQVGVSRQYRHVFRKIHARLLVHRSLVYGSRAHRAAFELRDERLLAVQQVELVRVQRFFHRIDDDIHPVVGVQLRYLVAFSHRPPVTLGEVGRTPRRVQVVDGHRPALGVHARTEHRGRAEQHAHISLVHRFDHRFP